MITEKESKKRPMDCKSGKRSNRVDEKTLFKCYREEKTAIDM